MAAASAELRSEAEIIAKYKQLRQELGALSEKINELEANAHEHDLVLKTLEPIDSSRKCFRLVGGVLVEQNVGLVKPIVKGNADNLEQVSLDKNVVNGDADTLEQAGNFSRRILEALAQQAQAKQKETLDFQRKYKIRVEGETQPEEQEKKSQPLQKQGVLVSKS